MTLNPRVICLIAALWNGAAAAMQNSPVPACPVPTLDGSRVIDPAQHKGKVIYVDFWASWCGPCVHSFSFMNQLHAEMHPQGVEVIAVNLDEEPEAAADFLKKHPAKFTVVTDSEGKCPALYDVKAMPTSYLIDRHGKIRHVHLGFKDGDKAEIRRQIQALLNEP